MSLHFIAQQIHPPGFVFLNCPLVQAVSLNKGHFVSSTLSPRLPSLQHRQCLAAAGQTQKIPGTKGLGGWRTLSSGLQELPDTGAPPVSLFSLMENTTESFLGSNSALSGLQMSKFDMPPANSLDTSIFP